MPEGRLGSVVSNRTVCKPERLITFVTRSFLQMISKSSIFFSLFLKQSRILLQTWSMILTATHFLFPFLQMDLQRILRKLRFQMLGKELLPQESFQTNSATETFVTTVSTSSTKGHVDNFYNNTWSNGDRGSISGHYFYDTMNKNKKLLKIGNFLKSIQSLEDKKNPSIKNCQ